MKKNTYSSKYGQKPPIRNGGGNTKTPKVGGPNSYAKIHKGDLAAVSHDNNLYNHNGNNQQQAFNTHPPQGNPNYQLNENLNPQNNYFSPQYNNFNPHMDPNMANLKN